MEIQVGSQSIWQELISCNRMWGIFLPCFHTSVFTDSKQLWKMSLSCHFTCQVWHQPSALAYDLCLHQFPRWHHRTDHSGWDCYWAALLKCQRYWLELLHFMTVSSLTGQLGSSLSVCTMERRGITYVVCAFSAS